MAEAILSFLDGTKVTLCPNMTVREVRKAFTPRSKLYTPLDLCYETSVLGGDDTIGSRHLQGVWRKVKRGKLSWCPEEDPHLWERIYVDGAPTGMRRRIPIHGFLLEILRGLADLQQDDPPRP